MLKQIAWNTFKNTGDINTFMELAKVDAAIKAIENNLDVQKLNIKVGTKNGSYKNKGNNNSMQ